MSDLINAVLQLIKDFFKFLLPFGVLDQWEAGVRLRFGKYCGDLLPGFHWKYPLNIDVFHTQSCALAAINLQSQTFTRDDGAHDLVDAFVLYRLDPKYIRKYIIDLEDEEDVLSNICLKVIINTLGKNGGTFDEAKTEIEKEIQAEVRRKWGIIVEEVNITNHVSGILPLRLFQE